MSLKNYKGPTSGRITIGGGPGGTVTRESFTQETDPVLTKDEVRATQWFRDLPPNEQYREVRRLKWNADERAKVVAADAEIIKRMRQEIDQLSRQLAQFTPEGYEFPRAARDLIDFAAGHGWKTAKAWTEHPADEGSADPGYAHLEVRLGNGVWEFQLSWSCDPGGGGRMIRSGLSRTNQAPWRDAPSLVKIKQIIEGRSS